MSFALPVIVIILSGIITLITIIMAIIALANGKTRNGIIWLVGFFIALVILILSIIKLIGVIGENVKTGIDWAKKYEKNYEYNYDSGNSEERTYFIDTLVKYTNESLEGKVPANFYSPKMIEKDENGDMVLPFLFPYSIKYNTNSYVGDIVVSDKDSAFVKNVSQMAFDQNFVIAKIDNSQSTEMLKKGAPEVEYLLFDMRTGNFENAPNFEKLMDFADRIGYTGSLQMDYLSGHYRGWLDSDYD